MSGVIKPPGEVTAELLLLFDRQPQALPLYLAFEKAVLDAVPAARITVQKTQVAFSLGCRFAFASLLPLGRAKDRPPAWITVSFGLPNPVRSPRIGAATQPYPRRWTHHVLVGDPGQIDGQLMSWITQAAAFAASRKGRS